MDSTEDLVSGSILASMIPPTLDDSFVVSVYLKVSANATNPGDGLDE